MQQIKIESVDEYLRDDIRLERDRKKVYKKFTREFRLMLRSMAFKTALFLKRLLDVSGSIAGLALLSPLLLITAILIKSESVGPVFYQQERVGRWGRKFRMYKFRSMYQDADGLRASLLDDNEMDGGVIFKIRHDPRITKVGKFIRRASIDELPQLINVLKGEMSLVGPRPALQSEVDLYSLKDRRRLMLTPGITCLWQVNGRSEIPFDQQVKLDLAYMESQSLWEDIKIIAKTIPAIVSGKGAF